MTNIVNQHDEDRFLLATIDDGKVNAFSVSMIEELHECLNRAEKEKKAIILTGREGKFSAGFDLRMMTNGVEGIQTLVRAGAELWLRLYAFPQPVIIACTGHAMAAGAILLFTADYRIGASGNFKIGLNEVEIGLALPTVVMELARSRLSPRHLTRATTQAYIYDPAQAQEAGYLDEVVDQSVLLERAFARANELALLPSRAFATTKMKERAPTIELIRRTFDEDIEKIAALEMVK